MENSRSQPSVLRGVILPIRHWWQNHVVKEVDHPAVLAAMQADGGWSASYAFMLLMSAGIAILGLLLSSPAVVIGAMLISPLMGPIVGLGFGLATADSDSIRRSIAALAIGAIIAVLFTATIVLLSPLQTLTPEIAARTRPNLFDLVVALFSALAGAYAMIRGRHGTIVGVAIATALMPPLATVGFGLATTNMTVFLGAILLFFTNFVTIALSAAIMARLYGFGRGLSPSQTAFQSLFIIVIFVGLAIPLGFSLRQIAWEASATRQASDAIKAQFPEGRVRISEIDMDFAREPLTISASILTPAYQADASRKAQAVLAQAFGQPVTLSLEQIQVRSGSDTEAAQVSAAQASNRAAERLVERLSDRLAYAAGVSPDDITIDREHKRAFVRATPLPDAGLATYRVLEQRTAAIVPDWRVSLTPPPLPLPDVILGDDGMPTPEGTQALALAIWAAQRLSLPVEARGSPADAEAVARQLRAAGITASVNPGPASRDGRVRLSWQAPNASSSS